MAAAYVAGKLAAAEREREFLEQFAAGEVLSRSDVAAAVSESGAA